FQQLSSFRALQGLRAGFVWRDQSKLADDRARREVDAGFDETTAPRDDEEQAVGRTQARCFSGKGRLRDGWDSGSIRYEMQKSSAAKFHYDPSLRLFIRSPRRRAPAIYPARRGRAPSPS